MGFDLVIRGAVVVTAGHREAADIGIAAGRIVQLGGTMTGAQELFAGGLLAIPGGVDAHTHLVHRGLGDRLGSPVWVDDFWSGSRAAIAGGITTIGNMTNPVPDETGAEETPGAAIVREMAGAAAEAAVDWFLHPILLHPAALPGGEIAALAEGGHASIKMFLSDPDLAADEPALLAAASAAQAVGSVTLLHCEDGPMLRQAGQTLIAEGRGAVANFPDARPVAAEVAAVDQAIGIARRTGARVYIVHLSSAAALDRCRRARAAGLPVYVETRPLYLHLTRERFTEPDAAKYVGAPPLREASDREALWAGLASGDVDTVCSDHAPWTLEAKLDPGLTVVTARQGVADLETLMPMLYSEGVAAGRISLDRFVSLTSANAARIFGLYPRKGTIAVGSDADIALWDPGHRRMIDGARMQSLAGYSVYDGWQVQGWPRYVVRRGQVVLADGEITARPGEGEWLRRPATDRALPSAPGAGRLGGRLGPCPGSTVPSTRTPLRPPIPPGLLTGHMTELPRVLAARFPVTDTYHGVDVTESYRWLEDASSVETIAWTKAQQQRTRAYFDGIPWRDALRARVEQLLKADRTTYKRLRAGGSTFFALKVQTPRQRPFLVALADLDDPATERVVVDPDAIDPSGETAIDFFVPSPDGKRVAVSLSEHGTEDGSLHVYDVETGKVVDQPIPHVNLMGGSAAWRHDGSGFWYTRCADPVGFRQQVWLRELDDAPDRLDLAGGFADERIAENYLSASPDGRWVMDRVQKGDGGEWQVFLRSQGADGSWWQVAGITDKCVHAVFGTDALYLLSRQDAPHGKVLRLPVTDGATVTDAHEIVPASDLVIEDLAVTRGTVWVVDMDGGPQQVRAFDPDGRPLSPVEIPPMSSVSSYSARLSALGQDRIAWSCESFTKPATWWVAADGEAPRPTALRTATPVDLSGYEVTREFATSRDGTRVPLNVITAPGTPRDGTAPALLTAYGGYGISLVPGFDPELLLWLEQGGVYVVANIRGGGEFGEEWRHAGRLAAKQNCFDDFIACAEYLHRSRITSRERLAIMGGSNGGLLMGAVLTQRPDVAGAVIAAVPVMDSLRSETTTNGRFNTPEYGTVEDPELFTVLLAYSPYHNVADGTAYPAVLLTAGENDTRVDAWHAKKMTARLQEATSSDRPVLLRLESTGHLAGSLDQSIDETTDRHAFLFGELGLGYRRRG